jgi:4-hydroxy-tetrahydrodipicolinate synthase
MVEIFRICHEGAAGDATIPGDRMKEVGRIVDQLTFPLNVACGIAARGFHPGAPKTVVSKESARLARQIETEFRRYFKAQRLV